jgi:glycosyltransferase involved in cell wall biosynthesis
VTRAAAHVCLVTPGHLSTDPRLVKEAEALAEAGYQVTTVCGRFVDWATAADREFQCRPWKRVSVPFGRSAGRFTWLRQGLGRASARALRDRGWGGWRERACHPALSDLSRAACRIDADLFVGHNLAGLVAAGRAAQQRRARLGFDAEDDHVGELPTSSAFEAERRHREAIHRHWLPRATHLTAASPLIAACLSERYQLTFTTVLNVFPISSSAVATPPPVPEALNLGWVSQTVGPGRGLEDVLEFVAQMRSPVTLSLRGRCDPAYRSRLLSRVAKLGIAEERVRIEPPVRPGQLDTSCRGLALGLSPEIPDTENKRWCLGNKIFHYLLAGVPVLLSRTPAQVALAAELGAAGLLVDVSNSSATAARLDAWLHDAAARRASHEAAWRMARERFCWDVEKTRFLDAIGVALGSPPV